MTTIAFLSEWAVRSSALILAGAMLLCLLRVRNPSIRLAACTAMLAGSLAIPLLTVIVPRMQVAAMRVPAGLPEVVRAPLSAQHAVVSPAEIFAPDPGRPFDAIRLAAILYGAIAGTMLLRLFAGLVISRRILRRSAATTMRAAGKPVRESREVTTPVTIGILRPAVLVPPDWRDWDAPKVAAVLAHEASHIRRCDPAVQFLSAIHRALLWLSPLSWWLHRGIVRAGEDVSDRDAIAAGSDPVVYAGILLEFVQRRSLAGTCPGVAMASYDRPEKRIRRILDWTPVPRAATRWGIAAVVGLGASLAYLVAAAQPGSGFEVATIKPVEPNIPHMVGMKVFPGGRVVASTLNLKMLISAAFRLSYWQISGGEEWIEKEEYNIEAKPSEAMQARIKDLRYTLFGIESEPLREMLQALLIERFQLKFHRETKTGDVYLSERSDKTLRVRPTEIPAEDADHPSGQGAFGSIGYVGGKWGIFATSMPQLAKFAADHVLHVPVLDRTDLQGAFDYRQAQPDLEPNYSGDQSDSFRHALAEMGFKLVRAKGPVETLVIDSAAKPRPD
jgi:uncharacterized protein (TIGR03435 family)